MKNKAIGLNFIDIYFRKGVYKAAALPFTPGASILLCQLFSLLLYVYEHCTYNKTLFLNDDPIGTCWFETSCNLHLLLFMISFDLHHMQK